MKTFIFCFLLVVVSLVPVLYAEGQTEEPAVQRFKVTSRYPAPYGEYKRLTVTGASGAASGTVIFKAAKTGQSGFEVTSDGLAKTQKGLVLPNCVGTGTGANCPAPVTADNGRIWFDTSVT